MTGREVGLNDIDHSRYLRLRLHVLGSDLDVGRGSVGMGRTRVVLGSLLNFSRAFRVAPILRRGLPSM